MGGAKPDPERRLSEDECDCPRLEAADWHEVESDWSDISFVRTSVPALAGVPIGYGAVREKLASRAARLGTEVPEDAMLLIGEGRLRREVLLEVEGGEESDSLYHPGGFAWSRLLPAHFGAMKLLARETREMARERYGREPDALYAWYLTCAVCSEARDWETLFVAHFEES